MVSVISCLAERFGPSDAWPGAELLRVGPEQNQTACQGMCNCSKSSAHQETPHECTHQADDNGWGLI